MQSLFWPEKTQFANKTLIKTTVKLLKTEDTFFGLRDRYKYNDHIRPQILRQNIDITFPS
jgi:hypothetical protein